MPVLGRRFRCDHVRPGYQAGLLVVHTEQCADALQIGTAYVVQDVEVQSGYGWLLRYELCAGAVGQLGGTDIFPQFVGGEDVVLVARSLDPPQRSRHRLPRGLANPGARPL